MEQTWKQRARILAAEFVVIVVGVLVALGADSAMGRYRERQEARAVLRALADDLNRDLMSLDQFWDPRLTRQIEARKRLEAYLQTDATITDAMQFVDDVRLTSEYITLDPHQSTLEELINSGRLSLVEDRELRVALLSYRTAVANIAEFDTLHRAYYLKLQDAVTSELVGGLALPYAFEAEFGYREIEAARKEAEAALDESFIRSSGLLRKLLAVSGQPQLTKSTRYRALRDEAASLIELLENELR